MIDYPNAVKRLKAEYERKERRDRIVFGAMAILCLVFLAYLLAACQVPVR